MKTLSIETSAMEGSIALAGGSLTQPREWQLPVGQRSARTLAPAIAAALAELGWKASQVELVCVGSGPGSFTGIRVGVVTAKAFGYAVGCPVVGVNTLEAIARQAKCRDGSLVHAVINAQRGELFAACFRYRAGEEIREGTTGQVTVVPALRWLGEVRAGEFISGPGLTQLDTTMAQASVVDKSLWDPQAMTIGQLGQQIFQSSTDVSEFDPFRLTPQYFRKTAAEEQWERRQRAAAEPG